MLKKLSKIIPMLRLKNRYPNVVYYDTPWFMTLFGILRKEPKEGFYSQLGQDELIAVDFSDVLGSPSFPKVFIDVGCNDPIIHSNSYFFESKQGYKVVAIDALGEIGVRWKQQRPLATFVECAVGATDGELSFDVVAGDEVDSMFSSVSGVSKKAVDHKISKRIVKVRRLSDIFEEHKISRAGIVSMDIEGFEYQAMLGIDFSKFSALFFIIENNGGSGLGDNSIRDLMIARGYIYYARIWNLDDIFIHSDVLKHRLS